MVKTIKAYIKKENEYTNSIMAQTSELQNKIYNEIKNRYKSISFSNVIKIKEYEYYWKIKNGAQYKTYFRKNSLNKKEELILDLNKIAEGHKYFLFDDFKISTNNTFIAYSVNTTGTEEYITYIKKISTDKIIKKITGVWELEWLDDNTIVYTTIDKIYRSYRAYISNFIDKFKKNKLLYEEKNAYYYLSVKKSESEKFLFLYSIGIDSTEIRFIQIGDYKNDLKLFNKNKKSICYIEQFGKYFYMLTNENAPNFKLVRTPVNNKLKENWKTLIPNNKNNKLDSFKVFRNYIVIKVISDATNKIIVLNIVTGTKKFIKMPQKMCTVSFDTYQDFNSKNLRLIYSSFTIPKSLLEYDMDNNILKLNEIDKIKKYNSSNYKTEKIYATAKDGNKIPISIIYKKELNRNKRQPMLLWGYGAYGICYLPTFSVERLSLLDRGVIFGIAHIRGGSEKGSRWYQEGKLLKKKNTFNDFVACAEHLIAKRYTSKELLVIEGASAGGLLIGSVINKRPELFKAAVMTSPVVELLSKISDKKRPFTIREYKEWGNPNKKKYYNYIKSYSPYENIKSQRYPNILVIIGINDVKVYYLEVLKFIAKMRKMKSDNNLLLLRINISGGHVMSSKNEERYKSLAFKYAFILMTLGIKH
ncbi:MAG: prolyl oligopeptidase family serine peptidase [Candidatus Micrarchaeia archaeon]